MSKRARAWRRTVPGALVVAALATGVTGCASSPSPLATLLDEPQSTFDRVAALELDELDDDSTRYLGEHDDRRYWVGTHEDDGGALCLAMLVERQELWVLLGCGRLPLSTYWMDHRVRLVPDGAHTGRAAGGWTFVTPNLLVQELPHPVFTG